MLYTVLREMWNENQTFQCFKIVYIYATIVGVNLALRKQELSQLCYIDIVINKINIL